MALPCDKPLSEPMVVSLLTYMCVTRPHWVNYSVSWPQAEGGLCRRGRWKILILGGGYPKKKNRGKKGGGGREEKNWAGAVGLNLGGRTPSSPTYLINLGPWCVFDNEKKWTVNLRVWAVLKPSWCVIIAPLIHIMLCGNLGTDLVNTLRSKWLKGLQAMQNMTQGISSRATQRMMRRKRGQVRAGSRPGNERLRAARRKSQDASRGTNSWPSFTDTKSWRYTVNVRKMSSAALVKRNKTNLRDLIAAGTGLVILLKLDSNRRFFSSCDLEIWLMTSKNYGALLLHYIKLCASSQTPRWIQTGVTVRKRSIRIKIGNILSRVTLKFDGWHWKTIGHLFYMLLQTLCIISLPSVNCN